MAIKSYSQFVKKSRNGWSGMVPHSGNDTKTHYAGETAKTHYVGGKPHSINGQPSRIYFSGKKEWHKNGELHNENGPAVTYPESKFHPDGHREYYLNGEKLSKSEFHKARQQDGPKIN